MAKRTPEAVTLPPTDYILALDMSLAHTGFARADLNTGEITQGLIEPAPLRGMSRLAYLRDHVLRLAEPPHRTLVFIEGYAFGARGAAVVSLGELGGVLRLTLHDKGIPYVEIPPTQVKKFLTGKGNVQKDLILKEVYKRYGADIDDNNIADAYALLQLALAYVGKPTRPLVAFQKQVVSDIIKAQLKACQA